MNELFKLSMCIFGTMFLFIGLVSLINTMPDLFFLSLPINLLFVLWFHYQLVKKYYFFYSNCKKVIKIKSLMLV